VIRGLLPAGIAGRELVAVVATASLASVTISLGLPLLSLVLHRHGVDAWTIGLNTTAGALGSLVAAPLVDRVAGRIGAVRTMQAALALAASTFLLFPLAVDLWLWSLWRMLLGAAGALLFVVSEAAINALAPPERRGRILALYATAFSLGYAGGPLLLALTGSEGVLPFLVAAGLLLAAALPLARVRGIDRLLVAAGGEARGPGPFELVRRAALPLAGMLVYAALETGFFALLPVYLLARGRPEVQAALLLSVWIAGNIALQLPIGWAADRLGALRTLGLAAAAALLALLLLDPAVRAGWAAWPLLLLGGGVMGALYTLSLTLIGERFRAHELMRANAAFVVSFQFGLLLGPAAVGLALREAGPAAFAWPLAAALLALLAAILSAVGRLDRRGAAPILAGRSASEDSEPWPRPPRP
jgi:MFS family permease